MDDRYLHTTYLLKKKPFSLYPEATIYDPFGEAVFYSRIKLFQLRRDFRILAGSRESREMLRLRATRAIQFNLTFEVTDSITGERVGYLKRQTLKSAFRDMWLLCDPQESEVGRIEEESEGLALTRRFVTALIPQTFVAVVRGTPVAEYRQNTNFFAPRLTLDFSLDRGTYLEPRLGIAAAFLLVFVEGRQRSN